MKKTQIISLFVYLTLVTLVRPTCLDSAQTDGQCTDCTSLQVLVQGFCYEKIRGCLIHNIGPVCISCQNGYVLSNSKCVRNAVFNNSTNLAPAPNTGSNAVTLTSEEIRNKLGEKYGPYFPVFHAHFIKNYPLLQTSQIKVVNYTATKIGPVINAIYQSLSGNQYQAAASIDIFQKIDILIIDELGQRPTDPVTAARLVREFIGSQLQNFDIFKISLNETGFYVIDFIDQKQNIVRVTTKPATLLLSDLQIAAKINLANLTLEDLAKQDILRIYPFLKGRRVEGRRQNQFYIFNFQGSTTDENNITVSVEFRQKRFIVNKPFEVKFGVTPVRDIFSDFPDLTDPRYLACLSYVINEYPTLNNAQVVNVKAQIVDGVNFLITFNHTTEQAKYEVQVFYNYQGNIQLLNSFKNNVPIFILLHDYNNDNMFLSNYVEMAKASKVVNIPPITIVSKKITSDTMTYQVSYSFNQILKFKVLNTNGTVQLISYTVESVDLNNIIDPNYRDLSARRSSIQLINFLIDQKPEVAKGKVKEIFSALPFYKLTVILSTGTYQAFIQDKKSNLILSQFTKLVDVNCYQLTTAEIQISDEVAQIDTFLKTNYPLTGFAVQLIQTKVNELDIQFRYLYANVRLQQIQFYLKEVNGSVQVTKASLLNYGLETVDPDPDNQLYQKAVTAIKAVEPGQIYLPFFTQSNSNFIRTYYANLKATVEITIDRSNQNTYTDVLSTKTYLPLPPAFTFPNLIIPQVQGVFHTAQQKQIVSNILNKVTTTYSLYFQNAVIKFAQVEIKTDYSVYKMLVRTDRGYLRLSAQYIDGTEKITSIVITSYKDGDFSTCSKFNLEGECLSCKTGQVTYQGSCFTKIEGCLIQPGDICVRCNSNYVQSSYKCFKQCNVMFP